ncbi:MAG TPA: DUF4380 domain-containing protein [Cellvibrio sp.]|nr:DUF4380 domain-containing protein [Cellvibrio sp.]
MFVPLTLSAQAEIDTFHLSNEAISVEITPDIGGRLLSAHLLNKPNILKIGDAVITNPDPVVSVDANNIGYLGHEIWVGPQSQWWQQQSVNEKRRAAKAVWPPDPFLILGKNETQKKTSREIILQSPQSPVSGVSVRKTYSLVEKNSNQIKLQVDATNIRESNVAWDIWFNTRVPHQTHIYVPVASMADVRVEHFSDETYDGLTHSFSNGFFALENANSKNKDGRKGKVFIQPSQGWMAAFRDDQLLIIQFKLQPKSAIHPEQGQIELYQEFLHEDPGQGLLELEVHAPYTVLQPGSTMMASEVWTILPYPGASNPIAHHAFLQQLNIRPL